MGGTTRRIALAIMLLAIALLVLTLALRPSNGTELQVAEQTTGRTAEQPELLPSPTSTPNPFTVSTEDESVTINRLWSPAPLVARAEGTTTRAGMIVAVESNGRALPPVTLDADSEGRFNVDIRGLEAGAQELCVAGACQRVLVAEPNQESRAVIESRIQDTITAVRSRLDLDDLMPGWTFVVSGPNSSVGGSADPLTQTITINANSGRSRSEYEITVLHEIGHAVDETWMTDDARNRFRSLRGLDATVPWGVHDAVALGTDRWRDAGEDFAEMFVALTLDANYPIATVSIAAQPSADDLRAFCELIGANSLDCDR